MRPLSAHPSSTTQTRRRRPSRQAKCRRSGRTNLQNWHKRIVMPAWRSSTLGLRGLLIHQHQRLPSRTTLPFRCLVIKTAQPLISAMASSGDGALHRPQHMMGRNCAILSAKTTPPPSFGPTLPIAPRPTINGWRTWPQVRHSSD